MQVIGFNLSKVSVQREEKPDEKISIKQNINIDDIDKDKVSITKDEVLKIAFTFSVDYNEAKFAKVELQGRIILLPEKDEFKKIMKSWKDKQVPPEIRIPLLNFIMSKCNVKALQLEDELNLPLHIPLPKLSPKKEEK